MRNDGWSRRSALTLTGVALGSGTAVAEFGFLLLAGAGLVGVLASPRSRDRIIGRVHRCARQLATLEQRRLARFHRVTDLGPFSDRSAYRYVAVRWLVGLFGGLILLLLLLGLVVAGSMLSAWLVGGQWGFIEAGGRVTTEVMVGAAVPGAVLAYLIVMGIAGIADLDVWTARRHLAPSVEEVLARRVSELALSRAEVVQVVNDERRRIERDLHDGVQQRLVALGMLLSRALRTDDPAHGTDLVRQAHEEAQQALGDLREVAWRVYPTVLDQFGLHDVLAVLAERSSIPVTLRYELAGRPPATTETVAYFVVSEAVSNAAKHSGAGRIEIVVAGGDDQILVTVTDDGRGGADPAGRGLSGLAGRVAATDGRFVVRSPPGGPTVVRAELLCV
jgi:signal transduction histidine kinase